MATPIFKCIHASDLHLDQSLHGLGEIPVALIDPLLDAPYLASESIFTLALSEEVDCLLLTGDILSAEEPGPRSLLFLVEQCERLAEKGIAVYWAMGGSDPPARWQGASLLPTTVHRLGGKDREVLHPLKNGGQARLLGPGETRTSVRATEYPAVEDDLISLALGYGACRLEAVAELGYHYWALGGQHLRSMLSRDPTIHYAGTPQGRSPEETGPRGCTLVEIDATGSVQTSPIVTDAVRWSTYTLQVNSETTNESLYTQMAAELSRGLVDAASRPLLVAWKVIGTGPLVRRLQAREQADAVLEQLNTADRGSAAVWHVDIEVVCPGEYPAEWFEEESIRGEFLRSLQVFEVEGLQVADWESYLPPGTIGEEIAERMGSEEKSTQQLAVKRAADLGVHLLSGEDVESR